jgi:hypothetical protein
MELGGQLLDHIPKAPPASPLCHRHAAQRSSPAARSIVIVRGDHLRNENGFRVVIDRVEQQMKDVWVLLSDDGEDYSVGSRTYPPIRLMYPILP